MYQKQDASEPLLPHQPLAWLAGMTRATYDVGEVVLGTAAPHSEVGLVGVNWSIGR